VYIPSRRIRAHLLIVYSLVQRQAWLMGLLRHELDFSASPQLLDYLRSDAFQETLRPLFKEEYAVDLHTSQLPSRTDYTDVDANVSVNLYLTYHPKYPHQFKDAVKHLNQILAEHTLDTSSINKRSFSIALLHSDALAQSLQNSDLAALGKQFGINLTLEPEATIKPFGEDSFKVLPISLSYYRNASANVSDLLSHLTSTLKLKTTDILNPSLPTAEPDTYPAYTKAGAYDKARKEFYDVRHTQEIERRVAREEALWTGAEFGPSPLDIGMQLEDQKYEEWRGWAEKEIMAIKQLSGSSGNARDLDAPLDPEDDADVSAGLDEVEASVPGSKRGQGAKGGAFVHA
jgi:hypothetical protein